MPVAFRAVHPDFRSRNGFQWSFPGGTTEARGPFSEGRGDSGCPAHDGDGVCLALTAAGMASGGIPAITVLVCEYDEADVLGQERDGSKIRVRKAKVLSVHDLPAVLRGDPNAQGHEVLPTSADLRSADLHGADLYGANLHGANLYGANLRSADLYGANLHGADLYGANLHGANLYGANLRSADLYGANLHGANLRSADLRSADLHGANLYGANLRSANLYGAIGNSYTRLPSGYAVSVSGLIVKS